MTQAVCLCPEAGTNPESAERGLSVEFGSALPVLTLPISLYMTLFLGREVRNEAESGEFCSLAVMLLALHLWLRGARASPPCRSVLSSAFLPSPAVCAISAPGGGRLHPDGILTAFATL